MNNDSTGPLSERFENAAHQWLEFLDRYDWNSMHRSIEELRAEGDPEVLLVDEVADALRALEKIRGKS